MRRVISNTSCLIALSNIGKLDLLRDVYGFVFVTDEVVLEFGEPLPGISNDIEAVLIEDEN